MEEKRPNTLLRRERELKGWSQKALAALIGTNEQSVNHWESGLHKPSKYFQAQLCQLYGKSAEELGFIQPRLNQPPTIITPATDANQPINERLDQAESIINLAWEVWFASRPKQATREITKLLPNLEKLVYMPLATVDILHTKELVTRCHGLLGAIYLDARHSDSALYHYIQAHKFAEEIHDINLTVTYLALMGDVLRHQNDKAAAISYMENARDLAANANQATLGHVLQLLSYAYGDIGNETAFEQTISNATDLLAFAGDGRDEAKKRVHPF